VLQYFSKFIWQARVERSGRVFRGYGLLPGRLSGTCGCLGGEDYMRLENLTAYCVGKWTCDIGFGDYDSICNNFSGAAGNWRSQNESWTWSED
jgi:hypothetical protein